MIEILLTRGMVAIIDDADLPLVAGIKWQAEQPSHGKAWYARGHVPGAKHGVKISMHQLILPGAPMVDHKNGDGLDNRRENLRAATGTQNQANKAKYRGASRYKGVTWHKKNKRWCARIRGGGSDTYLGHFRVEADAARAYNVAALRLFGEFARLNVIEAPA